MRPTIFLLSLSKLFEEEPLSSAKLRTSNVDFFEGLIKAKKFNDTIKGLTIYAEDKDANERFKNIYIKKNNSQEGFQITFAKKGSFELKGNKKILVLYDGQTLTHNGNNITNFNFSKSDFGLTNMDSHLVTHKKIQEQSTITLLKCLQSIFELKRFNIINCNRDNPRNIFKELFKRLISPFYLPVLILISLILILSSKESLKYNKIKYLVFLIGFLIIILSESSLGYISDNLTKNSLISVLPIILALSVYLVFIYKLSLLYRKT